MASIMEIENEYTSGLYSKRDVVIVRGKGARLYDENGREYIDLMSGYGVALVGYGNPYLAEAIAAQANTLNVCHEIFYNDARARLLEKLASLTPAGLDRFYLCSSGAEAVEAALKFARLVTGRKEIIATMKGFHGRTMGALSATWNEKYRDPFKPLVPEFQHVPFNRTEELKQMLSARTAGVIVEIIQGEGGINIGDDEYFYELRDLCDKFGTLLIIDEIQTGWGRTGKWFACQHPGIIPDMMTLGKGMAGGVPMGAVALGGKVKDFPKAIHGSTFGGNPIACAAGLATLKFIEENNLVERSRELGEYFLGKLKKLDVSVIREVRGKGLMMAIELKKRAQEYSKELMENGILTIMAGPTILRILPPLVITREDIDEAVIRIDEVLS